MCACAIRHGRRKNQINTVLYLILQKRDAAFTLQNGAVRNRFTPLRGFAISHAPFRAFPPYFTSPPDPFGFGGFSLVAPKRRRRGFVQFRPGLPRRSGRAAKAGGRRREGRVEGGSVCADCSAPDAWPRVSVTGFSGSSPGGLSLPWIDRRRRAGRVCPRDPRYVLPTVFCPAGFSSSAIRRTRRTLVCSARPSPSGESSAGNLGASRSITSSSRSAEQGSNCPPCEDDGSIIRRNKLGRIGAELSP
jgi:hypothetical protein